LHDVHDIPTEQAAFQLPPCEFLRVCARRGVGRRRGIAEVWPWRRLVRVSRAPEKTAGVMDLTLRRALA
jgi:hypothetical protein